MRMETEKNLDLRKKQNKMENTEKEKGKENNQADNVQCSSFISI